MRVGVRVRVGIGVGVGVRLKAEGSLGGVRGWSQVTVAPERAPMASCPRLMSSLSAGVVVPFSIRCSSSSRGASPRPGQALAPFLVAVAVRGRG